MARFLNSALSLFEMSIFVLAWSVATDGLSLDDQLQLHQKLTENYIDSKIKEVSEMKDAQLMALIENYLKINDELVAKGVKLEELELKVSRLEETVQQQQTLITAFQKEKPIAPKSNLALKNQPLTGRGNLFSRTCREVRAADPSLSSGMYWIDPDGQSIGDEPIYVYCDMIKGSTAVLHDSESAIDVGHCADPGCYSRSIRYNATMNQINTLADLSSECHQSIQYDCIFSPFQLNGIDYAWWNDKNGTAQYFWSGSNSSVHTCQCGIDHDCVEASMTCNCDSGAPVPLSDSGVITDKSFLPVTRLNFGRTQLASSSGIHTLGRFECEGQVAIVGLPKSCTDLWLIGHSLSGLYEVMGTGQVESVYCDFTKLPADAGFQTWIGYVDVKSSPVYFYVQRSTSFSTEGVAIPFEVAKLNVGGAMNLTSGIFTAPQPGIYFFSFSGISSSTGVLNPGLYLNSTLIGRGHGPTTHATFTLQSTLKLNLGDKISVQLLSSGTGSLYDDGDHHTHFTGWLLQEDLANQIFS